MPELREIYLPKRFSRIYASEGVSMLGTSSMLMTQLPENLKVKITGNVNNSPLRIMPGDILISRSGTVGTSVLCGDSYNGFIASDDCIRLRVHKNIRGYIATYLKSYLGKTMLTKDSHGKVIKHLKTDDIKNTLIPLIDRKELSRINEKMLNWVKLIDTRRLQY